MTESSVDVFGTIGTVAFVAIIGGLFVGVLALGACSSEPPPPASGGNGEDNQQSQQNGDDPESVENRCVEDETLCDEVCVDTDTDPRHCGGCDELCGEGELCENGLCVSHGGGCPDEECTGLTYCEGESGLCRPGCHRDEQCTGGRVCDTDENSCVCPDGERLCGGACHEFGDPSACGEDCLECPDGGGTGTPRCVDGQCELECESGQRECNGECVECPSDATETICEGGECVADDCPDGQRPCGGQCVDCPGGADETACEAGQCVATSCGGSGLRACDGDCVECPDGATETECQAGQCVAVSCDGEQIPCDGECAQCPADAEHQICEGNQCVDGDCPDGQLGCQGQCSLCPTGPGTPTCEADQCVLGPCPGESFECPDGCCSWDHQLVESFHRTDTPSRIFDDGGDPHGAVFTGFSYFERLTAGIGGQWEFTEIEVSDVQWIAEPPAISVHSGEPRIFFRGGTDSYVRMYAAHPGTGSWESQSIEYIGDETGYDAVVSAGVQDDAHYAVFHHRNDGLVIAHESGDPGDDDWFSNPEVIHDAGNFRWYTETATDDSGDIHVVTVFRESSTTSAAMYKTNASGSWEVSRVGDVSPGTTTGERRRVSLNVDDGPLVARGDRDPDTGSGFAIRVAERDGDDWEDSPDIDVGSSGNFVSIAVERADDGTPHLLYILDGEVRHARKFDGQWHSSTISGIDAEETTETFPRAHTDLYVRDGQLEGFVNIEGDFYRLTVDD